MRGAGSPRGAASPEPKFPWSSSSSDGPSMAVSAEQAILGKESQCKVPGMWQPSPQPQDDHANGLTGPCRALLIPARLGQGSWLCLGDALRKIRASA